MKIVLSKSALRHFDSTEHKPAIPDITPAQFELEINERLSIRIDASPTPFCHLVWFENWTQAQPNIIPITPEALPFIKTEYEAIPNSDLHVLTRYFPGDNLGLRAKYLCFVVYDKEQMAKEGSPIDGDFAVVNIFRTMTMEEIHLPPITLMCIALDVSYEDSNGNSIFPLNKKKYNASVEFWSKNVAVRPRSL